MRKSIKELLVHGEDIIILIGPEGDFTDSEINRAFLSGFSAISLGPNTLRTETAGLVACVIVNSIS